MLILHGVVRITDHIQIDHGVGPCALQADAANVAQVTVPEDENPLVVNSVLGNRDLRWQLK